MQLQSAEQERDGEREGRAKDRAMAEVERQAREEMVQSLRRTQMQMQEQYTAMEQRMRREASVNKDMAALLAKAKESIRYDSAEELRPLDELEKELKSREAVVEGTLEVTRGRLDSGAFLDSQGSQYAL
ncbi:hypothetical protein BGZ54_004657 [Gamsiella multidivaricata]|nr:hypothetical protein BGZ54_004657 [Gamsiella multidivaricata]